MFMQRFGIKHKLDIVSVYKKGKSGKLSINNIGFVIDNYSELFNSSYDKNTYGLLLCMPKPPLVDKSHPMYSGVCALTGSLMNSRPEILGDLEIINFNTDITKDNFRVWNYNFYKLDINSVEVQEIMLKLIEKIPCFSE